MRRRASTRSWRSVPPSGPVRPLADVLMARDWRDVCSRVGSQEHRLFCHLLDPHGQERTRERTPLMFHLAMEVTCRKWTLSAPQVITWRPFGVSKLDNANESPIERRLRPQFDSDRAAACSRDAGGSRGASGAAHVSAGSADSER